MICRIIHISKNKHKFSSRPHRHAERPKKCSASSGVALCLHMHDIVRQSLCNNSSPLGRCTSTLSLCRAMFQDWTIDAVLCGVWDSFFGKVWWRPGRMYLVVVHCLLRHGVHAVCVKRECRRVCPSSVPWICTRSCFWDCGEVVCLVVIVQAWDCYYRLLEAENGGIPRSLGFARVCTVPCTFLVGLAILDWSARVARNGSWDRLGTE